MSSKLEEERESKRRALREGEWACPDAKCAQINDESRKYCDDCGKPKPKATAKVGKEIGKEMAEKSKGLFAAEDWVCSKCGNVNWARRKTCNVCNAPKLGDLEKRTGYGGGYMDRQDVEYVKRDYNEEFDEFGRKRKKKDVKVDNDREEGEESGSENQEMENNKKEEEDDDDGDEEDLGKYNFDFDSDPELVEKLATKATALVPALVANAHARKVRTKKTMIDEKCTNHRGSETENALAQKVVKEVVENTVGTENGAEVEIGGSGKGRDFESINSTNAQSGGFTGSIDDQSNLVGGSSAPQRTVFDDSTTSSRKSNLFSIEYYQQFFDVETDQVLKRLLNSVIPTHRNYIQDFLQPIPDLWGPFWVSVTLVFAIGIFGNLAQFIENEGSKGSYGSDFRMVTSASTLIFLYVVVVPFLIYGLLWNRKSEIMHPYVDLVCLYGYSLSIFIPVTFLWIIDLNWFRWALILVSVGLSGTVLIRAIWPAVQNDSNKLVSFGTIATIFILHFLLAFTFKEFYFDAMHPKVPKPDQIIIENPTTSGNFSAPVAPPQVNTATGNLTQHLTEKRDSREDVTSTTAKIIEAITNATITPTSSLSSSIVMTNSTSSVIVTTATTSVATPTTVKTK
ncbi:unnamed protein product [Caenorhabditis bovis]|uniref:RanBP2-type domain-containing protein n=1 Tax=Caenorhabditis bovis TaxID=2654633 RepID=A0A8S1F1J2_9PELO|nr:unnamed protein product [Caenorhabditis bovis]